MIAQMSSELTYDLEDALVFASNRLMKGRRSKPVVMHSLRVMFRLWEYGYTEHSLLVAAILHDTIEDSDITLKEIREGFGEDVGWIVDSVTFNPEIPYGKDRHLEMFKRVVEGGRLSTLLKCADTLDNSAYYHLCNNYKKEIYLSEKLRDFLEISKPLIGRDQVWRDLENNYQSELLRLSSHDPLRPKI